MVRGVKIFRLVLFKFNRISPRIYEIKVLLFKTAERRLCEKIDIPKSVYSLTKFGGFHASK